MRRSSFLTSLLISSFVLAQTSANEKPLKTQKYNGYGLPNTRFKKVKIDLSKKKLQGQKDEPSVSAPIITMPKTRDRVDSALTAAVKPTPPTPFLSFGLGYDFSYGTQSEKQPDDTRSTYLTHEFTPKIVLGDYTILADFVYVDYIDSKGKDDWNDAPIYISRKAFDLGRVITLSPNALVLLPLSTGSREVTNMKSAVGAGLTLGLNSKNLGIDQWVLNYQARYTKMNNEFNTTTKNDPVTAYQIKQRINVVYQFTDAFSFKTRFEHNSNYSAQNVVRNNYLHFEIFNYQFTENFSANIGHFSGGDVFTVRETDSTAYLENDLKFYDPKASEFGIGLGFSI